MAVQVGSVVTPWKADTREIERAFGVVPRLAREAADKVNREFGRIGQIGGGGSGGWLPGLANISQIIQGLPAIGQLAHALISPLRQAAETGVEFNDMIARAEIGFETMIGSSDRAKEHIAGLITFAQKTPFKIPEIIQASQRLQAMGFSASSIIPTLQAVGDEVAAIGGNTDHFDRITIALGQIQTKTRVMTQEMNQLTEAGVPAWDMLAHAIGKTVKETRDLIEAGKLKGGPAVQALLTEFESRNAGMMQRVAGRTVGGAMSNLEDITMQAAGTAFKGLHGELIQTINAAIQRGDLATTIATGMSMVITPASKLIGASVRTVLGGGITAGLTEAFDAAKSVLPNSITEMANEGILKPFKNFLGIHSPSTVFYGYGINAAQGFVLGLQDGLNEGSRLEQLKKFLEDPRIKAFLEAIKKAEGGAPNRIVGGGTFSDFSQHPNRVGLVTDKGPSTAAGSYQITGSTWRAVSKELGLPDFSEPSQIIAALEIFRRTGGLSKLIEGDFTGAVKAAGTQWQGLPGSSLGGKYHATMGQFQQYYEQALGKPMPVTVVADSTRQIGTKIDDWARYPSALDNREISASGDLFASLGISRQNPLPVIVVGTEGLSAQIPQGGISAGPVDVDVSEKAPELLDTTVGDYMQMVSIVPHAIVVTNQLGEAVSGVGQDFKKSGQLAFGWAKDVIEGGINAREEITKLLGAIPSFNEQLTRTFIDLPEGIGGIFGNAVREWDGTFQGFLSSLKQGIGQTLQDITAQLIQSGITKLLLSLGLSFLGGGGAGAGSGLNALFHSILPSWATSPTDLSGWHFASGGYLPPGQWGMAGEEGPEPIYGGKTGLTVVPNQSRQGGTVVNNYNTINVPVSRSSSYTRPKSRRQLAEDILRKLA